MKKFGHHLWITGIIAAVTGFISMFVLFDTEVSYLAPIVLFSGVFMIVIGVTLNSVAPYPKAVRNGPLVRAKVIEEKGRGYVNRSPMSRYTVQFTTEDGQEITGKTTASGFFGKKGDKDMPVRYNPQKPTQFMIDRDAIANATFFKEDLNKENPINISSPNFDVSKLQEQIQEKLQEQWVKAGVTSAAAMNMKNSSVQAKGVILSAQPTGKIIGNDNSEMELKIEVTRPNGTQYQVITKKPVPQIAISAVQAGRIIKVFYNPGDERNITIGL